jgi:hypothetical protein
MGSYDERPVIWGLQQHPRPMMNGGHDISQTNNIRLPIMTPSSTNTSSFNQEPTETAALLNVRGSTTTLTNIGGSFATSVV